MPDLRNIVLSGNEADDSQYLALREFDVIPSNAVTGNDQPVNFSTASGSGQGSRAIGTSKTAPAKSGFKPVWD